MEMIRSAYVKYPENLIERNNLEDIGVNVMIILKWDFKE
jgi:hypothetical protein